MTTPTPSPTPVWSDDVLGELEPTPPPSMARFPSSIETDETFELLALGDTELLDPDDTHLGVVDVELHPIGSLDGADVLDEGFLPASGSDELALTDLDPVEPLDGLDLG